MTTPTPVVLIIEDDPHMRRFLRTGLSSEGFRTVETPSGRQGVVDAETHKPDLIVLDLGLPDLDGVRVVEAIRRWSFVPIVILSARDAEHHKIEALDAGADDYLTKPFGLGELTARLRVALRHAAMRIDADSAAPFQTGELTVDLQKRLVFRGEEEIHLTPIQYRLLALMVKHAGRVLTHRQILKDVWGPSHVDDAHYLRIYMSQLRRKLEADAARPRYLLTESGVGYRLKI